MQSIQAGTTATLVPDSITPDTLGQGYVVEQENSDGTETLVAIAGGQQNGWNVQAVDSPNITITVPANAAGGTYRAVSKHIANGSPTGNMYNLLFTVIPAAVPPPTLTAQAKPLGGVPSILLKVS